LEQLLFLGQIQKMLLNWSKLDLKTIEKINYKKGTGALAGRRLTSRPLAEASLAPPRAPILPPHAPAQPAHDAVADRGGMRTPRGRHAEGSRWQTRGGVNSPF